MTPNNQIVLTLLMVCAVLFAGCRQKDTRHGNDLGRVQMLDDVILGLKDLSSIAKSVDVSGNISAAQQNNILNVVQRFKSPESISMFARACRELADPMEAGDRQCDEVLDFAFWTSVSELAKRTDASSVLELESMSQRYGQDGGNSLRFKAAKESQLNRGK